VAQFSGNDDAGADRCFANLADALRHKTLRSADQVGDDIGIE
jgi:hypothetical protein